MKISKNSATSNASTQAREATKSAATKAKKTAQSTSKQAGQAADRLLQARTGAVGQLLNPLYGDLRGAGEARQQAPDGAMPDATDATKNGGPAELSMEGTLGSAIKGAADQTKVDLGIQMDRDLGVDRDRLGGGTQVDGRNPNETYTGGGTDLSTNPYNDVGKEAAGKQPLDIQAALDWYNRETQKAAAEGNEAKVEKYANEVHELVNPPKQETSETENKEEELDFWDSTREGVKQTASGHKHTGGKKTAIEEQMEAAIEADDEAAGREKTELGESTRLEQGKKAEKESGLEVEGGTKLAETILVKKEEKGTEPPSAEDRDPDSESPDRPGPDHLSDFIKFYHDQKLGSQMGNDIDYGPNDGPGSGDTSGVDSSHEQYVGEYDQGYRKPTEEEIAAAEARMKDATDVGPEVNEL